MTQKEQQDAIARIEAQLQELKGTPLTDEPDEAASYDEALGAVETLVKANVSLPEELELEGYDEEVITDEPQLRKGGDYAESDDEEGVDALPLINALLKGHNGLVRGQDALGRQVLAGRRDSSVLAKAVGQLMAEQKVQGELLRDFLNAGRGSATRQTAREATLLKAVPPGGRAVTAPGASGQITGRDILAKATFAAMRNPAILTSGEVARLEGYVNGDPNFTLDALKGLGDRPYEDPDPSLAMRVEQAIASTTAAA